MQDKRTFEEVRRLEREADERLLRFQKRFLAAEVAIGLIILAAAGVYRYYHP